MENDIIATNENHSLDAADTSVCFTATFARSPLGLLEGHEDDAGIDLRIEGDRMPTWNVTAPRAG